MKARIAQIDIESTPILGYAWKTYDTNLIEIVEDWRLLCVAWKWLGESKIQVLGTDTVTEKRLTNTIWRLFDEADIVVAHNGDRFDIKKLQAKFLEYGLKPPSPFKSVDTLRIARQHFGLSSNKLTDITRKLKLGQKAETGGMQLWFDCMDGCPKAWAKMKSYNKHDVALLEKVYLELRPWTPRHPNMAVYSGTGEPVCSCCGSKRVDEVKNKYYTNSSAYRKYRCLDCGAWSRLRKADNAVRPSTIMCDRK